MKTGGVCPSDYKSSMPPHASMAGGDALPPSLPAASMCFATEGLGVNQRWMETSGPLRRTAPSVFPKAHLPLSTICMPHPAALGTIRGLLSPWVHQGTRLPCQLPGSLETRFSHPPCFQGVMERVTPEPAVPSLIKKPKKRYWLWFLFCHPRQFCPLARPCPNSGSWPGSSCVLESGFPASDASKTLPRGLRGKEPACQCRRPGFDPWVGKIRRRRKWQPTPVFLPG